MKFIFSALFILLGVLLALIGELKPVLLGIELSSFFSAAGGFTFSAGVFSVYFELHGKEVFAEKIWREANAAFQVREAGVIRYSPNSASEDLSKEILRAKHVTYFGAYSPRLLKRYQEELRACLERGGTVRIILQARHSPTVRSMKELGWNAQEIDASYDSNEAIYRSLKSSGKIRLYYHKGLRAYSCTIIDGIAHISFASNSNGRRKVPRLICAAGGSLYDFVWKDCEFAAEQSEHADGV